MSTISDGFEVKEGEVTVGETYPLYGMITKFIEDSPGRVVVEINHSIHLVMFIKDQKSIDLLKERAFDPGIFVTKVITKEPSVRGECGSVIFGKRSAENYA